MEEKLAYKFLQSYQVRLFILEKLIKLRCTLDRFYGLCILQGLCSGAFYVHSFTRISLKYLSSIKFDFPKYETHDCQEIQLYEIETRFPRGLDTYVICIHFLIQPHPNSAIRGRTYITHVLGNFYPYPPV